MIEKCDGGCDDVLKEADKALQRGEKVIIDTPDAEIEIEEVDAGDRVELSNKIVARGSRGIAPLTKEDYFCLNCSKSMKDGCTCEHQDWALGRPECTAHEVVQSACDKLRMAALRMTDFDIKKEDIVKVLDEAFPANKPKNFGVDEDEDKHR